MNVKMSAKFVSLKESGSAFVVLFSALITRDCPFCIFGNGGICELQPASNEGYIKLRSPMDDGRYLEGSI